MPVEDLGCGGLLNQGLIKRVQSFLLTTLTSRKKTLLFIKLKDFWRIQSLCLKKHLISESPTTPGSRILGWQLGRPYHETAEWFWQACWGTTDSRSLGSYKSSLTCTNKDKVILFVIDHPLLRGFTLIYSESSWERARFLVTLGIIIDPTMTFSRKSLGRLMSLSN